MAQRLRHGGRGRWIADRLPAAQAG
jgi:hypothetical protein